MEFVIFKNADHVQLSAIPKLDFCSFAEALKRAVDMENCRIAAFFTENDLFYALLIDPAAKCFRLTSVAADEYTRSLTPEIAALHWFEREIAEQSQHKMAGHPWLKPIRFENSDLPGVTDYFTMQGNAVHEVAVGPVHAGVIEPGHFRFQCMGEDVYNLEIELGYQHRGIEKMLINASGKLRSHLAETAAGDSSIAYALTIGCGDECSGGKNAERIAGKSQYIAYSGTGIGAHCQSCWRYWRFGWRCGFFADQCLLRPYSR